MNKKNKACPPKRRGSALIFATILLFVVLSLVVSMSYVTVLEQKMSQKTKSSVGAFYNSESGIEWALNKIANNNSGNISSLFSFKDSSSGEIACPNFGNGVPCSIYLLDSNGKIVNDGNANVQPSSDISMVKAVRSVGTQNAGEPTERAIEAAVASGAVGQYQMTCMANGGSSWCCRIDTGTGNSSCKYTNSAFNWTYEHSGESW